jgi:hypothetical protein
MILVVNEPAPLPPPPTSKTVAAVTESGTRHPGVREISVRGIETTVYGPERVVVAIGVHCVLCGERL